MCLVGFVEGRDYDGHLFGDCTFAPLVEIREHLEFHDLMELDKTSWPRCLLWHGWLPLLSGTDGGSCWALTPAEGAVNILECALGRYSSGQLTEWQLPADLMLMVLLSGLRTILMFGLMVVWLMIRVLVFLLLVRVVSPFGIVGFGVTGIGVIGMTVFVMILWLLLVVGFCSVPGPLQTVQRAELWGIISCTSG